MKISALLALAAGVLLGGCQTHLDNAGHAETADTPTRGGAAPEYFPTTIVANPPLPFSEAVRVGETLYLAGQLGTLPGTTKLAPGGIEAEARQVMENIKAVLERHGTSLDHAVKFTVFLADMKEWPAFNAVYRQYFPNHFPARSALGANGLAFGARVEVECVAWIPSR